MDRRTFLKRAGILPFSQSLPTPPNIILILADDLGYGTPGCYGGSMIQTPNIDALAASGRRFTQAYAPAPICAASRRGTLTGRHNGRFERLDWTHLEPGEMTIASHLQGVGYRTGIFGKWGLTNGITGWPDQFGFDRFYGALTTAEATNAYPDSLYSDRQQVNTGGAYAPDLYLTEMFDFMQQAGGPFFAIYSSNIPHIKYPELFYQVPNQGIYASQPWPAIERDYAAMVTYLDDQVGQIIANAPPNTLIIFTSDNGAERDRAAFFGANDPLRGHKGDVWEGGIRVPFIAHWPGVVPAGETDHLCWLADLPATFGDLAGVPMATLDGESILPALMGCQQPARAEPMYWGFYYDDLLREAVRVGDWKAVRFDGGPIQLYDLVTDPGEAADVAADWPGEAEEAQRVIDSFCPWPKACRVWLPAVFG